MINRILNNICDYIANIFYFRKYNRIIITNKHLQRILTLKQTCENYLIIELFLFSIKIFFIYVQYYNIICISHVISYKTTKLIL